MPLGELVSFAIAKLHVMIGANFLIFIGKVKGICGSLSADVRPITRPFHRARGLGV